MFSAFLLAASLVAFSADAPSSTSKSDLEAYRLAESKSGRSADSQIRLALWCESRGLSTERLKHLALAVLYDPKNALARGLMGLVSYQGKWKRPEDVSKTVQDDSIRKERVRQYLEQRVKTRDRAEDQIKLALWCEQNDLKDQATAHFHRALQLDPSRELAWKHLGFKKVGGRWIKPDLEAAAKAEAREQQKANTHWKPILDRLNNGLKSKDASRRAKTWEELAKITDRRAVPMIWATFEKGDVSQQQVAVQVLGQIDDAAASRALVMLAVFSDSPAIRGQAIATLRRRDSREFAGTLIGMIRQPIKYEVKKVQAPGKPGELLIKGQGSSPNVKRVYSPPAGPDVAAQRGDRVVQDENGLPVIFRPEETFSFSANRQQIIGMSPQTSLQAMQQNSQVSQIMAKSGFGSQWQKLGQELIQADQNWLKGSGNPEAMMNNSLQQMAMLAPGVGAPTPGSQFVFTFTGGTTIPVGQMALEAQRSAASAQQQLQNDVDAIDQFNNSLSQFNNRVVPVLKDISGMDIGPDPTAWLKWFNNLVGYNQLQASERPTVTEDVPLEYQPQPIPLGGFTIPISVLRVSCFGAGTMVRTLAGSAPIEKLKVGDQVLTQSTKTGALKYNPILVVHHNPPSTTYRLKLGQETVVSSQFHRFWKPATGWVMARDLKVGDPIRTLNGTVQVTSIEDGEVVPVYNLDVAEDADFFVGQVGALAHDNSLPNLRERPFDNTASTESASKRQ